MIPPGGFLVFATLIFLKKADLPDFFLLLFSSKKENQKKRSVKISFIQCNQCCF